MIDYHQYLMVEVRLGIKRNGEVGVVKYVTIDWPAIHRVWDKR